jgi:hypothetical protein
LNYGLARARGEFVVVYDAEDRPAPDQLKAAVRAFGAGGQALACVQAPLVGLLASLGGVSRLIRQGDPLPEFDFHCPLMSLPLALKTRLDSIPAAARYLLPNAAKTEVWKNRLGGKKRMRIGLAWSGSQIHRNDKKRSSNNFKNVPYCNWSSFSGKCNRKKVFKI